MSLQAVVSTGGTHRVDIWLSMLNEIKESSWEILFGRGLQSMHQVTLAGHIYDVVAHNHYIQVMYDQGVIGLVLFGCLVAACMMRCAKRRVCVAVALIGMLGLGVSLSFNSSVKTFWNLVAYAAFVFPADYAQPNVEKEAVHQDCEED